jgi:hypothetical protein
MYFVTTKRNGYILFCTTPSERAALGLTEKQVVHLLTRESLAHEWRALAEWNASQYSHTDFLAALHHVDEPTDPQALLNFVPANLRERSRM